MSGLCPVWVLADVMEVDLVQASLALGVPSRPATVLDV